jgi:hypothetical protein
VDGSDNWRLKLICALDWVDARVLQHGHYGLCVWLAEDPWWEYGPVKRFVYPTHLAS